MNVSKEKVYTGLSTTYASRYPLGDLDCYNNFHFSYITE
jgi:hypothetical protein